MVKKKHSSSSDLVFPNMKSDLDRIQVPFLEAHTLLEFKQVNFGYSIWTHMKSKFLDCYI